VSLKEWFFGAEVPGAENSKPAASPNSPSASESKQANKPAEPAKKPDAKAETKPAEKPKVEKPAEPKASSEEKKKSDNPFTGPATTKQEDVEHTQVLTKSELDKLKDQDKERKPIKFVPPEKASKPDQPAAPEKKKTEPEASKPEEKKEEKPAAPPSPPPPSPKAATWKVAPVKEPWAPEAVTKEFPELDRLDYQDHEYAERIVSDDWRVIGGSRRGRKQAHDSRFREDAMAFGSNDEVTVLVVADGAGSSKYSRIGSHVAVHETVDSAISAIKALSDEEMKDADKLEAALKKALTASVRKARGKAVSVADKSKLSPKDFRATLLTIVHYHAGDKELLVANQIGDGAISLLMKDKSIRKFGASDSGAFSGEVSCFLTDKEAEKKAEEIEVVKDVKDVEAMFLCSDGIEDPFYPIDKKSLDIFQQWMCGVDKELTGFKFQPAQPAVFEQEAAAPALAQWLEFEKRGENDDRTILVMHRHPATVRWDE